MFYDADYSDFSPLPSPARERPPRCGHVARSSKGELRGWTVLVSDDHHAALSAAPSANSPSSLSPILQKLRDRHVDMASATVVDDEGQLENSPRFNRLLSSVLGSPFVTTSDLPPSDPAVLRRLDAGTDLEEVDGAFGAVPRAETITRPTSPTPSFLTDTYSLVNWNEHIDAFSAQPRPSISDAAPSCSFLPSAARRSIPYNSFNYPYAAPTPFNTLRYSNSSTYRTQRNMGLLPRLWETLRESSPTKKGKRRLDITSGDLWAEFGGSGYIDYANLPPLDGEEGELIDDEACFIDVRAVTGLGEWSNIASWFARAHRSRHWFCAHWGSLRSHWGSQNP